MKQPPTNIGPMDKIMIPDGMKKMSAQMSGNFSKSFFYISHPYYKFYSQAHPSNPIDIQDCYKSSKNISKVNSTPKAHPKQTDVNVNVYIHWCIK